METRFFRLSLRLYRWLMLAYPVGFRELYEADMLLDFEDLYRDTLDDTQSWGVVGFWVNTLLDLMVSVFNERTRQMPYRKRILAMTDTTVFNNQLASTIDFMSRLMRGGYSIKQVMELAAENAPEPTASEMQATLDDAVETGDFGIAINNLQNRVESPHLTEFVEILNKQRVEGGNLPDKLDKLTATMREDIDSEEWALDYNYNDGKDGEKVQ